MPGKKRRWVKGIKAVPGEAEALASFDQAMALLNQNEATATREAISILENLFRACPLAEVASILGDTLFAIGAFDKAERYYLRGIKLDPEQHGLHVNLGVLYLKQDRIDAAAHSFIAGLKLDPMCEHGLMGLGHCYRAAEEWQKARDLYTYAIKYWQDGDVEPTLYLHRAHCHRELAAFKKAQTDLKRFLAVYPHSLSGQFALAETFKAAAEWKKLLAHLDFILNAPQFKLTEKYYAFLFDLQSYCYEGQADWHAAMTASQISLHWIEESLLADPDLQTDHDTTVLRHYTHQRLASFYQQLDQPDRAKKSYETAIALYPGCTVCRFALKGLQTV